VNLFGWCYHYFVFMCLLSPLAYTQVSQSDFSDVNEVIIDTHAPLVFNRFKSTIDLVELYGNFGGAFMVDSARKPIGEHRFIVTLTGSIPQSGPMSMDGYAIVACHEVGHILGGAPQQKKALDKWSSVEGQADYFATNQCMWKYAKSLRPNDLIRDFDRDFIARCDTIYKNDLEKTLGCLRILSGIQAMVEYFNRTAAKDNQVSIYAHDPTQVTGTIQKYPSPQCRVDTWMAGLFNQPRPRCWFKD
jgi:hypothetical protein